MVRRRALQAETRLKAIAPLWPLMVDYARGSAVTGASYSDYLTLWAQIRAFRPREVLECGSGISTVVIAEALRLNAGWSARPGHFDGGRPGVARRSEGAHTGEPRAPCRACTRAQGGRLL